MRLFLLKLVSLCTIFHALWATYSYGQNFPAKSTRLVNDYTNTLSSEEVNTLERKLVSFNDSSSIQIAVVLINSLEGYDANDYAVRLAESWGIGQKEKNNGLIILAAIQDRRVAIQTGYGMEGAVPDAIAKRIIEREIKPFFKRGDYYTGLDNATTAIIQYSKGEYVNDRSGKQTLPGGLFIFLAILAILIFKIFIARRRYKHFSTHAPSVPWWMLTSAGFRGGRHSGSWGNFSSGSGSFGGFGGGSFGGGGASGSW